MKAKVRYSLLVIILFGILLSGCNREVVRETPPGGSPTAEGGLDLKVTLAGESVVPGPGDGDMSGSGTIRISPEEGQVCPDINTPMPDTDITGAHIHRGGAGTNGPEAVSLEADPGEVKDDCVTADTAVLNEIEEQPANFYVDVHTQEFPDGAIRGQLTR